MTDAGVEAIAKAYYESGYAAATLDALKAHKAQVVPQPDRDGDDLEARIAHRQTGIIIREFARRLAWWEGREGHTTIGIPWLRNHFRLLLDRYPLPEGDMYEPFTTQPVLSPAPLTINREALAEWISVAIWRMSYRPTDREPSPALTCDVRWLDALRAADAVIAHLSAQTVEGEVESKVWHKDQFWVTIETDTEGHVTISDELLVKLMTESGWVVQS